MRTTFDPRLDLPKSDTRKKIEIVKNQKDPARISEQIESLQRFFPQGYRPVINWGRQALIVGQHTHIELIKIQRNGSGVLHPVLAHPKVPRDVLEAAVFLAMLMCRFAHRQSKPGMNLFDYEKGVEWVEEQMKLFSGSEFLAKLMGRFGIWLQRL